MQIQEFSVKLQRTLQLKPENSEKYETNLQDFERFEREGMVIGEAPKHFDFVALQKFEAETETLNLTI